VNFYERIGARLRRLRLRAGLSQAALGARLGVTAGAINRYEMGRRRVPLRDIPRMASILGVASTTLLGTDTSAGRVEEESPVYGRRGIRPGAAARAYAESLSPARLRALARRAGVGPRPEAAPLRRYAELIAMDFAQRAGRRHARPHRRNRL
jgi:transcriptional regulator with XRE-family HTH domain